MEYFSQFKWAVPTAFSDALGQCQFGEGDILYPKKFAYNKKWEPQKIGSCLQVVYPPRQMKVLKEDITEVFKKNWDSEVHIQKYVCISPSTCMSKDGGLVVSTQGRLYTSLWKGDLKYLNPRTEVSMPTVNTKEAVRLRRTSPDSKTRNNYIDQVRNYAKNKCAYGEVVFAMPYDSSNNTSNGKFRQISTALKDVMSTTPKILTPEKAGIDNWRAFLPTVYIALFATNITKEGVYERVKKATYVPSKDAKTNRYDIRKHGTIFN